MDARHYDIVEKIFNINVNVFIYENHRVPTLKISKKARDKQELNTLIITNDEGKVHYVFIKDFNRLMFWTVKAKNNNKQ